MKGKNLLTHLRRFGAYSVLVMFASLLLINNLAAFCCAGQCPNAREGFTLQKIPGRLRILDC